MSAALPNGVVPKISLGWNGQLLDRHEIPIKMSNADRQANKKAVQVYTLINPNYEVAQEIKETVKINGADIKVSFWVYKKMYKGNSPPQIVPAYVHFVEKKPQPYLILGNEAEVYGSRYEIPVLDASGKQYKESRSGLGINPDEWWQVYSTQPPTDLVAKKIMSSVTIGGEVKDVPIWMYYKLYDGARDKNNYKQQHWITNWRPDECPKTCKEVTALNPPEKWVMKGDRLKWKRNLTPPKAREICTKCPAAAGGTRKRQNRKRKTLRKRN